MFDVEMTRKLRELQALKAEGWTVADMTKKDLDRREMPKILKLAERMFGQSDVRYSWKGGDRPYRYGAVLEFNRQCPNVFMVGFHVDPPDKSPRKRYTLFRCMTAGELEAQAKPVGML